MQINLSISKSFSFTRILIRNTKGGKYSIITELFLHTQKLYFYFLALIICQKS